MGKKNVVPGALLLLPLRIQKRLSGLGALLQEQLLENSFLLLNGLVDLIHLLLEEAILLVHLHAIVRTSVRRKD